MKNHAAILVEEKDMDNQLFVALKLVLENPQKQQELAANCKSMAQPKAAHKIVNLIEQICND